MDVLNRSCENYGTAYEHFSGGLILGFRQSSRQKSTRGIVVANPEAARLFANHLLQYADQEQKMYTTTNSVTYAEHEKKMEAKRKKTREKIKVTKKKVAKKTKKKVRR